MSREPTKAEKEVFGANCYIDPATDNPVEQGHGSALKNTAQHKAALALSIMKGNHAPTAADFAEKPAETAEQKIARLKAELALAEGKPTAAAVVAAVDATRLAALADRDSLAAAELTGAEQF